MDKFTFIWTKSSFIKFPILAVFLGLVSATWSVSGSTLTSDDSPSLSLAGYVKQKSLELMPAKEQFKSQATFQNEFVSKNGSDFVIAEHTKSVTFACEAIYPIQWKFPFPKQVGYPMDSYMTSIERRVSNFSQDFPNPIDKRFQIRLRVDLRITVFLSANITCSSVENPSAVHSSIHLYMADKSGMEYQGQTLSVSVDPTDKTGNHQTVTLPCRPTSPKLKVALQKDDTNSSARSDEVQQNKTWRSMSLSENHISYDPKIGFSLDRGLLGNKVIGLYRCSVLRTDNAGGETLDANQFVLVNVTQATRISTHNPTKAAQFESRKIVNDNASVYIQITAGAEQLVCCSGVPNKPPKIYLTYCEHPLNCEIKKNILVDQIANKEGQQDNFSQHLKSRYDEDANISTDCSLDMLIGSSTLVACIGKNVDFAEQYVNIFHKEVNGPVKNRSERVMATIQNTSKVARPNGTTVFLSKYVEARTAQSSNVTQKMFLAVAQNVRTTASLKRPASNASKEGVKLKYKYESFERSVYQEFDRDVFYEEEELTFVCFGVKLFYSEGPYLRLNWKNGTKTILESSSGTNATRNMYLHLSGRGLFYVSNFLQIVGKATVASKELSSVDCGMPVRNTGKWDMISKLLEIQSSVAPRFAEDKDETVSLKVGEVGKAINCTVVEGAPPPLLKLTRDGKQMEFRWMESNPANVTKGGKEVVMWSPGTDILDKDKHLMKLTFRFNNVTKENQHVWQCIAQNVNGTVTRTINALVMDEPTT